MEKTSNPSNKVNESERIKTKINKTRHNSEIADDIMSKTNDDRLKKILKEKNARRQEAVKKMRDEISSD